MERYYNDDEELAVLISPGYGAGWSTWNDIDIALDSKIIEYFMRNPKPTEEEMSCFLEENGYHNIYMGGYENLKIKWIPKGTSFLIMEYDGSEYIEINKAMITA